VSWQLWDHLASGLTAEQHSLGDSTDVLGAAMNSPLGTALRAIFVLRVAHGACGRALPRHPRSACRRACCDVH